MNYSFGAHMSISGGLYMALKRIKEIGGSSLQLFSASPRGWNFPQLSSEEKSLFLKTKNELNIDPVYFHASYLINLANEERIGHLSRQLLTAELNLASQMQIRGSIIHLGSFKDRGHELDTSKNSLYSTLITHIGEILAATPKDTYFIVENAGNRKIGRSIEDIAQILHDVGDERVRVCLDTCHLFSAGYRLQSQKQLDLFLDIFDKKIGLQRLEVWHLNDSRDPFDSGRDRHENIGEGTIGPDEFRLILNDSRLRHLPFIIETPGFDGNGPDKKNLDVLKSYTI